MIRKLDEDPAMRFRPRLRTADHPTFVTTERGISILMPSSSVADACPALSAGTSNEPMQKPLLVRVMRLRAGGMFSNVNEAIQAFYVGKRDGFLAYIDWTRSLYIDDPGVNAWTQYFVQPEERPRPSRMAPPIPRQWSTRDNIIAPRLTHRPGLAPPRNRVLAKAVIDRHLILQPALAEALERAYRTIFGGNKVLGLHLRGPGRNHGGVPAFIRELRATKWPNLGTPPYKAYFDAVDRAIANGRYDRIFLCTDATCVRERVTRRYGKEKVVWYDACLTRDGEMHERPRTHHFSKRQLGEDVLIEAYLLSRVDFLVHGNSNVTNFVLCNAPWLPAEDIFQSCYSAAIS